MDSEDLEDYDDLRKKVEANDGLLQIWMEDLRELHDAGRLGKLVRQGMSSMLHYLSKGTSDIAELVLMAECGLAGKNLEAEARAAGWKPKTEA